MPAMRRSFFVYYVALATISLLLYSQQLALPLKPDSVRFAIIGDMGTGEKTQYELADKMVEYRQKFPFEFVIMLGDNFYDDDRAGMGDYESWFERHYKPLLDAGIKSYATLGNHDKTNQRFYKPFNLNGQQYYTYKKTNIRFFALDCNYMSPQQLSWLEKELQNSGSDWKIRYFHHPLYSSAAFHGSSTELRGVLESLFIKYGMQVVFAGNLRKTALTAAGYDHDRLPPDHLADRVDG